VFLFRAFFFIVVCAGFQAAFGQEGVGVERLSPSLLKPEPTFAESTLREPPDRLQLLKGLGPVDIRPHFAFLSLYNDNIFIEKTNPDADFVQVISPGLFLGAWNYVSRQGVYMQADYTPSVLLFLDHPETDTVDHRVSFAAGRQFQRSAVALSQTFESTSDPTLEGGGRLARKAYNTTVSGNYDFTDKTSFEANLYQILYDYEASVSTREWASVNWLNYRLFPKIDLAAGAGAGYVQAEPGTDAVYEKIEGRTTYEPTAKMSYTLHTGLEFRQFQGGAASGDLISPIFGLEGRYQPYDATSLGLRARREVRPSNVLANQVSVNTGVSLQFRQRFFQKYFLSLTGGYENAEYETTVQTAEQPGKYDYYFFRTDLAYEFKSQASVSLFYQYQDNDSNQALNGYQNNQVGLGFSYRF